MHGYVRYTKGCRCEVCREAKAAYMRAKRGRGAVVKVVPDIAHGINGYWNYGCRCETCRDSSSSRRAELAHRHRVDPRDV